MRPPSLGHILLASFMALCCAKHACGQLTIGHHAGPTWSQWSRHGSTTVADDYYQDKKRWSLGWTVGVPLTWSVSPHVRLCSGIDWVQKGELLDQQRARLNYLQISFRVGFPFHIGRSTIQPEIGGAYGWFTGGTQRIHLPPYFPDNEEDLYSTVPIGRAGEDAYNYRLARTEFALTLGVQASYPWQGAELTLNASYQLGFTNLLSEYKFSSSGSAYNNTFLLEIGYALPLGRHRAVIDTTTIRNDSLVPPKPRHRRFMIGQRFGMTSSWLSFDASLPSEVDRVTTGAIQLQGITTAVMARIPLSDHWSLRPELAYVQKGWRCKWYPRPTFNNDVLRFNYLELPVLVEYAATGHGAVRPFIFAGPTLAMGVGGIDLYDIPPFTGSVITVAESITFGTHPEQGDFARWDVAATMGVGLSAGAFLLDVRYAQGLLDIYQEGQRNLYSNEVTARHRVISLSFGYLLPFK